MKVLGWRRLVLLAFAGLSGGVLLSLAVTVCSAGYDPTLAQLRYMRLRCQAFTAPIAVRIDEIAGRGLSQDDYAVYRAVIEAQLGRLPDARVAIGRRTEWPRSERLTLTRLTTKLCSVTADAEFDTESVRDFFVKNQRTLLMSQSQLGKKAIVVERAFLEAVTNQYDGWDEFRTRFKGAAGFLALSRPGYDWKKTRAVVYVSLECGTLCGRGAYLELERVGDIWRMLGGVETWVA